MKPAAQIDLARLKAIDADITTACNLRCGYCYHGRAGRDEPAEMSPAVASQLLAVITAARYAGADPITLNFYGGEPLLATRRIAEIVEAAEARGLGCRFTAVSNGTIANPDLVAYCTAHQIAVQRSTDGCPAAAQFHRPGATALYEAGTLLWKDYDRRRRVTVTPETAPYMLETLRYLAGQGFAKGGAFVPDGYRWWHRDAQLAAANGLRAIAEEFVRDFRRNGAAFYFKDFHRPAEGRDGQQGGRPGCGAGRSMLAVSVAGNVFPCHRFTREPTSSPFCAGTIQDLLRGPVQWPAYFGDHLQKIADGWDRPECRACIGCHGCARGCYHINDIGAGDLETPPEIHCYWQREAAWCVAWIDHELRGLEPRWWTKIDNTHKTAGAA